MAPRFRSFESDRIRTMPCRCNNVPLMRRVTSTRERNEHVHALLQARVEARWLAETPLPLSSRHCAPQLVCNGSCRAATRRAWRKWQATALSTARSASTVHNAQRFRKQGLRRGQQGISSVLASLQIDSDMGMRNGRTTNEIFRSIVPWQAKEIDSP
jgi:hypothetical protein